MKQTNDCFTSKTNLKPIAIAIWLHICVQCSAVRGFAPKLKLLKKVLGDKARNVRGFRLRGIHVNCTMKELDVCEKCFGLHRS